MKKILFFFLTFLFFSYVSAGGGEIIQRDCPPNESQTWYKWRGIEFCTPTDPEILRVTKMLSWQIDEMKSYKLSNLEKDIQAKEGEYWDYQNSIQSASKKVNWNRNLFLNFTKYLRLKNIKEATGIYAKNITVISPFLPTCCVLYKYIWHKAMKNGILSIYISGQDGPEFFFEYIYYRNGSLFSINKSIWFRWEWDDNQKKFTLIYFGSGETYVQKPDSIPILRYSYNSNYDKKLFSKWLQNPSLNPYFLKSYDIFVSDMTKLWK